MAWNSKKFDTHQLSPPTHAHLTHAWGAEEAAQNHALSKHQLGSFRKLGSGVDSCIQINPSPVHTPLHIFFSHVYTFREGQTLSLKQPQFPLTHYLVLCNIQLEAANWLIQCVTFGVPFNIVQFCGIKVRKALCTCMRQLDEINLVVRNSKHENVILGHWPKKYRVLDQWHKK